MFNLGYATSLREGNYEIISALPYLPNPSTRAGYDTRSIFLSGV